ncbi:MAG: MOSC N-terminal beta barrel domain-containing protein [Cyclobacteriaceae bacterium]
MENPHVAAIRIYPVKSLDPIDLEEAEIGIHSLKNDRIFAMLADDGRFVNGKRTGRVNQLKTEYDLSNWLISLSHRDEGEKQTFDLRENNEQLVEYLSDFFGFTVNLVHRSNGELMDIPQTSSVTVLSKASLDSLHQDFADHSMEDLRLRFRANLEIGGVGPYWEEQLFKEPGVGVRFSIGDVEMIGISPRARCNVPPRNPLTGETDKQFIKRMMQSRSENLPTESLLQQHGGFYHLTVNTYLPEDQEGKSIKVGDLLKINEAVRLG